MREILRRVVAAFCLYAGVALFLTPGSRVYQVRPVDWNTDVEGRQQQAERLNSQMETYAGAEMVEGVDFAPETRGSLEEYIARETEGRLLVVSGPEWEGFWNDVAATVQDRAPSAAWNHFRGVEYHDDSVYLPQASGPLGRLKDEWPEYTLQAYVRIDPGKKSLAPHFLDVYQPSPYDLRTGAPTHIAFPYRTYGALLLMAGLLFYLGLPRRTCPASGMFYQARAGGWLPDFLATFASGFFFAIPFLITADTEGGPLDAGWWPLSLFMWGMASLFASIFVITTWYQTRRVTWDDKSLSISTWGKPADYIRADEVESVGSFLLQAPKWLRITAWIVSALNWRAASSAILLDRADAGFTVRLTDGRVFRFTGEGLWGAASFLEWLDKNGRTVDTSARTLMQTKPDFEAGTAGAIVAVIFAVLILGGCGAFLLPAAINAMPHAEPEFRAASFETDTNAELPVTQQPATESTSPGAEIPQSSMAESLLPLEGSATTQSPVQMTPEILRQETEILKKIQVIRGQLSELEAQIGTVSNPNATAIMKVQEAMEQLSKLQTELEALRSGSTPNDRQAEADDENT
jgi:hypothetical protein